MADPLMGTAALADLRALLPMVRHHVAMLSSPATAGQDTHAGMKLAELAERMATLCAECDIPDCAQLLVALHAALAQAPVATRWQPQFAAAALEAFGYVLHRIGALGIEAVAPPHASGQFAIASRLQRALETTSRPEADTWDTQNRRDGRNGRDLRDGRGANGAHEARRSDDAAALADVFADDDVLFGARAPAEAAELTDDERQALASYQSATLRVTLPPAPRPPAPETWESSLPRAALTDSGWAPGPADVLPDVLPDEPDAAPSLERTAGEQAAWRLPTAQELDEIPEEMKRIFLVETEEDLQDLRLALLRYEQHPGEPSALHAMGRVTHKIKGTAATLGFDVLAAVTHSYEDLVKALLRRGVEAGTQANSALLGLLVLLQASLDASNAGQTPDAALAAEAAALLRGLPGMREALASARTPAPLPVGLSGVSAPSPLFGERESTPPVVRSEEGESSLRVDVHRLDDLMRHLSALAVNRAALLQTRDDVVRLQSEMDAALGRLSGLSAQMTDLQPMLRHAADPAPDATAHRDAGDSLAQDTTGTGISGRAQHRTLRRGGALSAATAVGASGASGWTAAPTIRDEASAPVWDELELDSFSDFDSALRALSEVVADVAATSRDLRKSLVRLSQVSEEQAGIATRMQRDVMHVRLVPLSDIIPRLDFEVKVLTGLAGKSVAFTVSGEMTEIDRNISEALREPLLQLVRNAVVHGIEMPDARAESGKPAMGAVWVHAYYVGSEVIIEIGDDGRGINPHKLTASAVAAGLLESDEARARSAADALDLMFWPGVSTFDGAGAVSGRGIGLDEVRTAIQKLKGVISVRSEPGKGSVFRVRVPISLSIVHALRVLAGEQSFAVPFTSVKRTLSLGASEILTSTPAATSPGGTDAATVRLTQRIRLEHVESPVELGEGASHSFDEIPVYPLATLLGLEHVPRDPQAALLVEVGRQRVALLVDGVFEEEEVAVQALPRPLQRRAVRGASVTADGQVLLLLDLPELASGILDGNREMPPPRPRPVARLAETLAPRVLVVDDSVTIRQTLEHILRRGGFEVQLARDGIEALDLMQAGLPRVVVLDIEMPRLDGFEVLSVLRGSPQFSDVRVVMLTSRAAEKHKEHALNLGAQAYLIKPCPQETLLDTVRGLLVEPASGI